MRIITLPQPDLQEISVLKDLLQLPDILVHVRKPTLTATELHNYLVQFSNSERSRMVLHQHLELAVAFDMPHIHHTSLVRRNLATFSAPEKYNAIISTSTHSWYEFNKLPAYYQTAFVSPLFPSISKKGYGKINGIPIVGSINKYTNAIALGGISSRNITALAGSDFQDFALCGAVWEAQNPIGEATQCHEIFNALKTSSRHASNDT